MSSARVQGCPWLAGLFPERPALPPALAPSPAAPVTTAEPPPALEPARAAWRSSGDLLGAWLPEPATRSKRARRFTHPPRPAPEVPKPDTAQLLRIAWRQVENVERAKVRKAARIANGGCRECTSPKAPGKSMCKVCLEQLSRRRWWRGR